MRLFVSITVASLKMYFRNRQAIFWSLFFPLLIMLIFGLLDFDRFNPPEVAVVDEADNDVSGRFIQDLHGDTANRVLDLRELERPLAIKELHAGDVHAVIVLPPDFGRAGTVSTVQTFYDRGRPQEAGVVLNVTSRVLDQLFMDLAQVPPEHRVENRFQIESTPLEGQGQGYAGFLVPGVVALSIMQLGIFGVTFALVRFRAQGVLRRLRATPIDPGHFLVGQIVTRLVIAMLQVAVLFIIGAIILDVTVGRNELGTWLLLLLISMIGAGLFISVGLAISGVAKNEDTAAPIANIIAMPMMFLSGVFFPVGLLPGAVQAVSRYLPLTFLADGIRALAVGGGGIAEIWHDLIGLLAWSAAVFIVSTRTFKWE